MIFFLIFLGDAISKENNKLREKFLEKQDKQQKTETKMGDIVDRKTTIWEVCEDIVKRHRGGVYAHVDIKNVYVNPNWNCFNIVLEPGSTASTTCENFIKGSHSTAMVWFTITAEGCSQRCWCKCKTTKGRKFGECRKFKSDQSPINENELIELFGCVGDDLRFNFSPTEKLGWNLAEDQIKNRSAVLSKKIFFMKHLLNKQQTSFKEYKRSTH